MPIDWSGHSDNFATSIEKTLEFNTAVKTVVDLGQPREQQDETLADVTADHETGYLSGA